MYNYKKFKKALVNSIHYYNHERIQIKLNGKIPVEFRRAKKFLGVSSSYGVVPGPSKIATFLFFLS
ncbi:IS3 family transposase [Lysinibacillus fusiformis]|uniref:IS3 family transposase n=1 Tax=Lysinibacillus sp. PWR01 TaxID=3342384 RepID=UPI00372CFB92